MSNEEWNKNWDDQPGAIDIELTEEIIDVVVEFLMSQEYRAELDPSEDLSTDSPELTLAESMEGYVSEPFDVTEEMCLQFLQPKIGQTINLNSLIEEFSDHVLLNKIDETLWEMAKEGIVEISVDDNGEFLFRLAEENTENE